MTCYLSFDRMKFRRKALYPVPGLAALAAAAFSGQAMAQDHAAHSGTSYPAGNSQPAATADQPSRPAKRASDHAGHDHGAHGEHGMQHRHAMPAATSRPAADGGHVIHEGAMPMPAPAPASIPTPMPATSQPSADPHASHAAAAPAATATDAVSAPAAPDMPMDHSDMRMQGGSAPPDARDPHGYAEGMVRNSGPYAVPGIPHLMMADEHLFAAFRAETLERQFTRKGGNATAYDVQGWFGGTYNRAVIKAEGNVAQGKLQESRTELLWGHAISSYWDTQLGLRLDNGEGPDRQWLAFGVQGLAPYWFEIDATAYVGTRGRTALRLEASYELMLTQRLVLEPSVEMQLYGKDDPARHIGRGLSEASAGLRLRYEFTRQFAPYIGVERAASFGRTADIARAAGDRAQQTRWVAGVRFWF